MTHMRIPTKQWIFNSITRLYKRTVVEINSIFGNIIGGKYFIQTAYAFFNHRIVISYQVVVHSIIVWNSVGINQKAKRSINAIEKARTSFCKKFSCKKIILCAFQNTGDLINIQCAFTNLLFKRHNDNFLICLRLEK